ncbi:MAG: glycine cleavage system protein GcvH [Proteobacteria bacterium]|nr:glycine cleavage system protein GcvH [Pseudomonadota bacterium]
MSKFPDDLKYASTHEWVRIDDAVATVGISYHAQDALGDIVFVELPELGTTVNARAEVAVVESVKAASDIYSPLSGKILEINEALADTPEIVNSMPYDNGWFYKMEIDDANALAAELDELMDAEAYADHCAND